MIDNYDPNVRFAMHTFRFTLQQWDYVGTLEQSMGGNCRGFDVMRYAIQSLADKLHEERGDNPEIALIRPPRDGDAPNADRELLCSPDGEDTEDWLMEMIVGIELIAHVKESP